MLRANRDTSGWSRSPDRVCRESSGDFVNAQHILLISTGPAGPLEALLDAPDGDAERAAVVFAHPLPTHGGTMHTKAVYQGDQGAGAHRLRRAALQLPRRRRERRRVRRRRGREGRLPAALDFMAARYPDAAALGGGLLVRLVGRAEVGAVDDRVVRAHRHRAAGHEDGYDFASTHAVAPSRSSSSRARRTSSVRSRTCGRSTRSCRSRRSW